MATTSKQTIIALTSVGIDIGKDVFHLVGFDPSGTLASLRRKIKRLALVKESKEPGSRNFHAVWSACDLSLKYRTSTIFSHAAMRVISA